MNNLEMLYYELDVNILIIGYRGYGHSQGTPSEGGLALDAEAIFQYVLDHQDIN